MPPVYTASQGLGGYTFTPISTFPAPAPNAFPSGFSCTPTAPTVSTTFTCSAVIGGGDSTSSGFAPTVTVSDTANATTPSGSQTSTAQSLTLHAALKLTPDATSADPPPSGVVNRQYGDTALSTCQSTGTAACKDLIYDAAGGLGTLAFGTDPTTIAAPGTGVPAAVTCSHAGTQETCTTGTSASSVVTASAGAYNFSITVDDSNNNATPDDATSSKTGKLSETITINNPIKFNTGSSCGSADNAVCISNVAYAAAWPAAVNGRPYGSGTCSGATSCAAPVYAATGGLTTTYDYIPDATTFTSAAALNFSCTPATTPSSLAASVTCSSPSIVSAGGSSYTPSMTAVDAANDSTPAALAASAGCAVSTTCTDPQSILTSTNDLTVNNELKITNTFLENATLGEPYSAILDSNRAGLGSPYLWCVGTVSNDVCSTSGGIAGVNFVTPSPAPSDDPTGKIRGYYQGTPTTPGPASTSIQVSDASNATTPSCSYAGTCAPLALTSLANKLKVFNSRGFVANYASNAGEQGDTLAMFDTNFVNSSTWLTLDAGGGGNPVVPRVTPDGQWVYVTKQGNQTISVVDAATGLKAINDFTVANSGTFNPTGLDFQPQQYFATNPNTCSSGCSNLNPFIRYDGYITDPTDGNQPNATVEPIPDAENPHVLSGGSLSGANQLTVPDADNIAVSTDGTQAFVSLNYLPSDTACGAPPCNTLAVLSLPLYRLLWLQRIPPPLALHSTPSACAPGRWPLTRAANMWPQPRATTPELTPILPSPQRGPRPRSSRTFPPLRARLRL